MDNKAFTLIEILLYTAIFAVVGGLSVGILLTVTQVQQRESASAEVTGQLNFVMQTVQRLVSQSSNIEIEAGVATSTLKLRMQDSAKDPTCLSLVDGVIKLAEGPGENPDECTTETSDLTSSRVIVDVLTFKKFVQYPGHDTVSIDLTMTYNTTNPKGQVQRTLSSAIARVSAATFDSNLLPGSDNSYDIGYSPDPRWRNAAFSGDLLVSGNVGIGTTNPANNLTIAGDLGIQPTAGVNTNKIYGSPAQNRTIRFDSSSSDGAGGWEFYNSNLSTSLVYVKNSGNVGIGTAEPNTALDLNGALSVRGTSTPATSPSGQGRIYFDSTANKFKVSENAGSYTDLVGAWSFYLYNNTHTDVQCESAGGLVRSISSSYLCQFTGSSCPDGWTPRLNWGITYPESCSSQGCLPCTTGSHEWNNTAAETCSYYSADPKQGCIVGPHTCTASFKAVGCY